MTVQNDTGQMTAARIILITLIENSWYWPAAEMVCRPFFGKILKDELSEKIDKKLKRERKAPFQSVADMIKLIG